VPEIKIATKEKFSILDKVLISAFNKEKLVEIYQCKISYLRSLIFNIEFPFLQRVTTDDNNKEFAERLQRMKAELMMNDLA
jgi:hypothetical protein